MLVALLLASGCFGYTRSAKRWAYVGNTVLVLGGGAVIAADQLGGGDAPAMTTTAAPQFEPPVSGALVAGVFLVAAGLVGYVFNATRREVTTSR